MRTLFFTLLALPTMASAQVTQEQMRAILGISQPVIPQPYIVQPVAPLVPVLPNNAGPYNRGYSIVTTTRERPDIMRQYLGDKGATYQEQTTEVVPNDALGNPVRPFRLW